MIQFPAFLDECERIQTCNLSCLVGSSYGILMRFNEPLCSSLRLLVLIMRWWHHVTKLSVSHHRWWFKLPSVPTFILCFDLRESAALLKCKIKVKSVLAVNYDSNNNGDHNTDHQNSRNCLPQLKRADVLRTSRWVRSAVQTRWRPVHPPHPLPLLSSHVV